jgi:hypothetical protein
MRTKEDGLMRINRKTVAAGAAVAALATGGVGIANAVGGGSEDQLSGPSAERAKSAALEVVGGGSVTEVERQDGDGDGAFEVEVRRPDGSQVEVHLDLGYNALGTAADDDYDSGEDEDAGDDD